MSNIIHYNEMERMALAVTKSGMFGLKSENQAITLMLIAQAEGIAPIQAIQQYSIINGIPSLKSTEVQARFQRSGGKVQWIESSTQKAICKLTIDGQEYMSEFTLEDAKRMGLSDKDNWKKMPKQMLMARAITMGVRAIYPQCLNNMYTADEVQDFSEAEIIQIEKPKEVSINYKLKIQGKLADLQLTTKEIKAFAEYTKIGEDENLLKELCNDDEKLESLVREFEQTLDEK